MRSDRERLEDILEAIENIHEQQNRGKAAFQEDRMFQVWVVHITCKSLEKPPGAFLRISRPITPTCPGG